MNTRLPTLALIVWALVGCDTDDAQSTRERWLETERKLRVAEAEREKVVAAARADLATNWTSMIVALRYDCSCTGTSSTGFRISREADNFTVTPWSERGALEITGESRQLSWPAVEKLLSEAALFYLAASLSESVIERTGPYPADATKQKEWRERYLAAGGSPEGNDWFWIDIRVVTPDGLKRHANMWAMDAPLDFSTWVHAFGETPRR